MKRETVIFLTRGDLMGEVNTGGLQCTRRNYQLLCRIFGEEQVQVGILTEQPEKKSDNPLVRYFYYDGRPIRAYWNYLRFRDRIPASLVRELAAFVNSRKPDLLFLDGSSFCGWTQRVDRSIRKLVFCHNIEKHYIWGWVRHQSWLFLPRFFASWRNESRLVRHADFVVCLNRRDAQCLETLYHRRADLILPISLTDRFEPDREQAAEANGRLLFVGSYFPPNVEGIRWFCRQVLPQTSWQLDVVGKGMEQLREELESPQVSVLGAVRELDEFYYRAAAVVMPVFFGSGMKVKTAEAMQYGKAIFAAREALEGYDIQGLPAVKECGTAEEFVQALQEFQKQERQKTYPEIRRRFLDKYETGSQEQALRRLLGKF